MSALPHDETWSDDERRAHQRERLDAMLREVLATNAFYRRKLGPSVSIDEWGSLPFTTKTELSQDQADHPPYGTALTYPLERYLRLHQTSGTSGKPLRILDTAESWRWWSGLWGRVYRAAGVTSADRLYFAFSFGPFIGFWSAFSGAEAIGALCISGGAQTSAERLAQILATEATALLCTPTYALRLAEVAREEGIDLARAKLRVAIHAGEPGASIPATRERIESALGVTAFDHTGATEVGATGFSCGARDGVHLIESEFKVEILDAGGNAREEGEGELVLTNLGRWGSPVIRYRTGDRVSAVRGACPCGRTLVKLAGGIQGRVDEMITVRGVNVFPSALEGIVRRFAEVDEFRIELYQERGMDALRCAVEAADGTGTGSTGPELSSRIAEAIHRDLGIRCDVTVTAPGTLPRFDAKARRFVRKA
ncbi:MAG TPA: phenylacetate--CoA ligase family protein [Candidatus Limnocylindria bacterium]|nr:phenylacetate--CoA ligase family protein [Candidatus Limnocylindria bacterium]